MSRGARSTVSAKCCVAPLYPVEPILVSRETYERRCREGHPLFSRIQAEAIRIG